MAAATCALYLIPQASLNDVVNALQAEVDLQSRDSSNDVRLAVRLADEVGVCYPPLREYQHSSSFKGLEPLKDRLVLVAGRKENARSRYEFIKFRIDGSYVAAEPQAPEPLRCNADAFEEILQRYAR